MTQLNALPTEPLLDESGSELASWNAPPEVRKWLVDLATERDPDLRTDMLYGSLRKQFGRPMLADMLRGILVAAVRNEYEGAAALNAFLGVRASGELLVSRVQSFSSLRRLRQRLDFQRDRNLGPEQQLWLRNLDELLSRLRQTGMARIEITSGSLAISSSLRSVFNGFVAKAEAEGFLGSDDRSILRDMARVELKALEMRALEIAGTVDPYAARHLRRTLPMLAEVDADVRNLGNFLDRMEEEDAGGILSEHITAMSDILEDHEEHQLRTVLENTPELRLGWRLLRGLDRNPLPQRTLAWFADRVLVAGHLLTERRLRKRPLDLAACALVVLDNYRDGFVEVPASSRVLSALDDDALENVEIPDGSLVMVLDRELARRMPLPHGLPLPKLPLVNVEKFAQGEEGPEATVKEMVVDNMNNVSVLLGLLKNQKVINTPGIVSMIAQRSRNGRVLDTICGTKKLYTGFANKDVPMAVLRSPMNIPIKALRKFVSVRFVSKVELKRLEVDRSAVRREVADEIRAYLRSLH
jgi:hypothetical protein